MQVVSRTHVGMVRDNNEDALFVREPYLFAVADGMGGHAAGEIASRATIRAFSAATKELRQEHFQGNAAGVLWMAMQKANRHVFAMASGREELKGMGTTMTALYLEEHDDGFAAFVAHVGDSRMYVYSEAEEKLIQVTRDQTYVASLVAQGEITPEEASIHPQRHMLMKAIGVEEEIRPDVLEMQLKHNNRVLLCSDGLTDMLKEQEILEIFKMKELDAMADALLEKALANGGRDNITFILIDLAGEEVSADDGK